MMASPWPRLPGRVGGKTARITNTGEYAGARRGIANGRISVLINSYAGHPAPQPIVAIGPILLLNSCSGEIAAGNIKLIPANSSRPVRVIQHYGLVSPQRFGAVAISDKQPAS